MIEVYTDGSTNEMMQCSSIGIYIKNGQEQYEFSFTIPYCSNHEAEFYAVQKALEICIEKYPNDILSFRTDSQIVVDAIDKNHVKNKQFEAYMRNIHNLSQSFPLFFIKWIASSQNTHADNLAKKACKEHKKS